MMDVADLPFFQNLILPKPFLVNKLLYRFIYCVSQHVTLANIFHPIFSFNAEMKIYFWKHDKNSSKNQQVP